jgi:hypothetical protein
MEGTLRPQAAVADRHVRNASSHKTRSVRRDVRVALDVERVVDDGVNGGTVALIRAI